MAALIRPCFVACFMGARRWRAALGLRAPARVSSQQAPCGVFTCGRAAHHSRPRCRRAPRSPCARASRPPRDWPTRARCVGRRRRGHTGPTALPHQEGSLVVDSRARHVSLSYGIKRGIAHHTSHSLASASPRDRARLGGERRREARREAVQFKNARPSCWHQLGHTNHGECDSSFRTS